MAAPAFRSRTFRRGNTIMLAIALGWAEALGAADIFCGVNAVDYSGYPDCRPEFIEGFENLANLATKAGVEGARMHIHAPLIRLGKADIVREGLRLGVDFAATVSCYQADERRARLRRVRCVPLARGRIRQGSRAGSDTLSQCECRVAATDWIEARRSQFATHAGGRGHVLTPCAVLSSLLRRTAEPAMTPAIVRTGNARNTA